MDRNITKPKMRLGEVIIERLLLAAAALSLVVTAAIIWVLLSESANFFARVSVGEFLTGTEWTPTFADPRYGILPLLVGTLMVTLIALVVALPLGLLTAIYLSEFAGVRARETIKPILELIAGVPTIVFGYFALLFVTPLLQQLIPGLPGFNMLSAGLVVGILIIPYIASVAEDAMRAVPNALREGSYAMGATKLETALSVVMPAAASGVAGAFVLGMSRAVGETMVVAIAAGPQPRLTFNPTEGAATITAYIAQVAKGDIEHASLPYYSIFAAGLALLAITLLFNVIAFALNRAFREAY